MIDLHHQITPWASINRQTLTLAIFPPRPISGQGTKGRNLHFIGICFVDKQCNISKSIYSGLREDGGGGAAENATKTPFKLKIKNLKGKGSKY